MKQIIYIFIAASLCFGCSTHKSTISQQIILSDKYLESGSVKITILYRDLISCINDQPLHRIIINIDKGYSTVLVHQSSDSIRRIGPIIGSLIPEINSFERTAQGRNNCGGYAGGHGVSVWIKIKDEETEYGFCKDHWDGINELLAAIEQRETK